MKIFLSSIGCRLNQSEIETLGRDLLAQGHEIVKDAAVADKAVVNTCAVTAQAARDARAQTRRILRQKADTEIYLTGCYATVGPDELGHLNGPVTLVNNKDKSRLIQIIDPASVNSALPFDQEPIMREFLVGQMGNTRAFVKVQDGCDNKCTFCMTTIARGAGASRRLGDIVTEVQALAKAGYKEVVITGVHLGSYGRDLSEKIELQDLVRSLLRHTDIPRLRLSSLEPWDINPEFFTLWDNPRLLPHLHMPLQSGSDRILRRMARRTTRASYRLLVSHARAQIPDLNLSTDIILGFPGETDYDFQESLAYVREIHFARLHAFSYSSRPGTAAAMMDGHLSNAVKKERTRRMIALGKELALEYHQHFDGALRSVLWETNIGANKTGLLWSGYSDNYIRVSANGPVDLFNTVTSTRLHTFDAQGAMGTILNSLP
ncbi:MAG: tRNA (N(6)-L-threonylcarbamoyladenosine(37)-C(2))-methylthiotransferase MtaB [Candidatus Promineifilaceae bacterium]|nr:tRNA (N(6)-L-threonylcarbamoyladenosine(37)-C(2))-methylthiotransferase MtaB [Candidatus Promineifilaceae bacterium]